MSSSDTKFYLLPSENEMLDELGKVLCIIIISLDKSKIPTVLKIQEFMVHTRQKRL